MSEGKEPTYFETRMKALGVTDNTNRVKIWQYDAELKENVLKEVPVFSLSQNGDGSERGIDILLYTLDRYVLPYPKEGSRWKKQWYVITRLKDPKADKNGNVMKYYIPKGQGTMPFFHPWLLDLYEKKEQFETLYITEGAFKAYKGCMHGLPVVGVSSITHLKDKEKGTIHADIVKLINACGIKRVVWLTDGDCLNLTHKEIKDGIDLYRRPKQFFNSADTFANLLADIDVDKWFAHIDSDAATFTDIANEKPKGLDDMLCVMQGRETEVVNDLLSFGKPGLFAFKLNITFSRGKLLRYFHLDNVNDFFQFHLEKRPEIRNKSFVWNGTHYRWDEEKSECKIMVPGEASNYFRVGDQYHEYIEIPNKHGQLERTFHRRMKQTIIDDHGKGIIEHIPRYKAFCSVPDHLNYQRVIHGNFNLYAPFEWEPSEEEATEADFPVILGLIKHIFGTKAVKWKHTANSEEINFFEYELGLDYVQLLLHNPAQKLPILCLVSKENGTGKSTFANFLKTLFTANCAIVGNADLSDNFNAHWASKLLIICDEAKIDKQLVIEKVKSLSTANKIMMNAKGKDHTELDFFGKFIFLSNNEKDFIYATEEDVRYWVRKVPVISSLNVNVDRDVLEEIPFFINYLTKRKLVTPGVHRAWFDPKLLHTEALDKIVAHSAPTIAKELRQFFRDKFLDFGIKELHMTREDIHQDCFNGRYERNYLEDVMKNYLRLDVYHQFEFDGKNFETLEGAIHYGEASNFDEDFVRKHAKPNYKTHRYSYPRWEIKRESGKIERDRVEVRGIGRHYVIRRERFLTHEEIANLKIDAEQQAINETVSQGSTAEPVLSDTPGKQEDLPF